MMENEEVDEISDLTSVTSLSISISEPCQLSLDAYSMALSARESGTEVAANDVEESNPLPSTMENVDDPKHWLRILGERLSKLGQYLRRLLHGSPESVKINKTVNEMHDLVNKLTSAVTVQETKFSKVTYRDLVLSQLQKQLSAALTSKSMPEDSALQTLRNSNEALKMYISETDGSYNKALADLKAKASILEMEKRLAEKEFRDQVSSGYDSSPYPEGCGDGGANNSKKMKKKRSSSFKFWKRRNTTAVDGGGDGGGGGGGGITSGHKHKSLSMLSNVDRISSSAHSTLTRHGGANSALKMKACGFDEEENHLMILEEVKMKLGALEQREASLRPLMLSKDVEISQLRKRIDDMTPQMTTLRYNESQCFQMLKFTDDFFKAKMAEIDQIKGDITSSVDLCRYFQEDIKEIMKKQEDMADEAEKCQSQMLFMTESMKELMVFAADQFEVSSNFKVKETFNLEGLRDFKALIKECADVIRDSRTQLLKKESVDEAIQTDVYFLIPGNSGSQTLESNCDFSESLEPEVDDDDLSESQDILSDTKDILSDSNDILSDSKHVPDQRNMKDYDKESRHELVRVRDSCTQTQTSQHHIQDYIHLADDEKQVPQLAGTHHVAAQRRSKSAGTNIPQQRSLSRSHGNTPGTPSKPNNKSEARMRHSKVKKWNTDSPRKRRRRRRSSCTDETAVGRKDTLKRAGKHIKELCFPDDTPPEEEVEMTKLDDYGRRTRCFKKILSPRRVDDFKSEKKTLRTLEADDSGGSAWKSRAYDIDDSCLTDEISLLLAKALRIRKKFEAETKQKVEDWISSTKKTSENDFRLSLRKKYSVPEMSPTTAFSVGKQTFMQSYKKVKHLCQDIDNYNRK